MRFLLFIGYIFFSLIRRNWSKNVGLSRIILDYQINQIPSWHEHVKIFIYFFEFSILKFWFKLQEKGKSFQVEFGMIKFPPDCHFLTQFFPSILIVFFESPKRKFLFNTLGFKIFTPNFTLFIWESADMLFLLLLKLCWEIHASEMKCRIVASTVTLPAFFFYSVDSASARIRWKWWKKFDKSQIRVAFDSC